MSVLLMGGSNGHIMQDNIEWSCLSKKSQSIYTNDVDTDYGTQLDQDLNHGPGPRPVTYLNQFALC